MGRRLTTEWTHELLQTRTNQSWSLRYVSFSPRPRHLSTSSAPPSSHIHKFIPPHSCNWLWFLLQITSNKITWFNICVKASTRSRNVGSPQYLFNCACCSALVFIASRWNKNWTSSYEEEPHGCVNRRHVQWVIWSETDSGLKYKTTFIVTAQCYFESPCDTKCLLDTNWTSSNIFDFPVSQTTNFIQF